MGQVYSSVVTTPPTGSEKPADAGTPAPATTPAPAGIDAAANGSPTNVTGDRPQWLPEKFKSAEDFAKAYTELEKQFHDRNRPQTPPATEAAKPATPATETKPPVTQEPPKPADLSKYQDEFQQNGRLTDQSYRELADKGLGKDVVDNYIAGQQAAARQALTELHSEVGGQENFDALYKWAGKGLSPEEVAAYNKVAQTGDMNSVKLALRGMYAKYTQSFGKQPNLVGGVQRQGGVQPFTSSAQVVEAMSDPRYKTDASYNKSVTERLAISNVL